MSNHVSSVRRLSLCTVEEISGALVQEAENHTVDRGQPSAKSDHLSIEERNV